MTHEPPRSVAYQDTYYSAEDGWAESAHVFLAGNGLAERFASLRCGEVFRIGELGFGTGLNVAAAMGAFADRGHDRGHLAIFTVEGHPLDRATFAQHAASAAIRWPEAAKQLARLSAVYPVPRPGLATLHPSPDVTLTIGFGDVSHILANAMFRADAWFLDGFSPSTNPAMWSEEVLHQVAHQSAPDATVATFTVAGSVRRGLTSAGFAVAKAPGFGRKREMLTGRLTRTHYAAPSPLGQDAVFENPTGGPVAVLGGGIAGASVAWHLHRLGIEVTIYDRGGLASGASGNPAGLVTPRLEAADNWAGRFYRDAFEYALLHFRTVTPQAFERTGSVIRMYAERAEKILATGLWPLPTLHPHEDGLFAPDAGVLRPRDAVEAMTRGAEVVVGPADWQASSQGFMVGSAEGERSYASLVIAAPSAVDHLNLGLDEPLLTGRAGQVDIFSDAVSQTITGDGYVAPLDGGTIAGAPYGPAALDDRPDISVAWTDENAATAARLIGHAPGPSHRSRAAVRAVTADRHPVAGPVPDMEALLRSHAPLRTGGRALAAPDYRGGLFVLSGLGSRGLVTAPLLGAYVAGSIVGMPSVLTTDAATALHPARFAVRALRRQFV